MVKNGETGPSVSGRAFQVGLEECATSLEAKLSQIDMELILSKDDAAKKCCASNSLDP